MDIKMRDDIVLTNIEIEVNNRGRHVYGNEKEWDYCLDTPFSSPTAALWVEALEISTSEEDSFTKRVTASSGKSAVIEKHCSPCATTP